MGDRYVLEMMQQQQWQLGGESSGHIICLDQTSTGDGIIAALQVLHEIVSAGQELHELKRGVTKYPQSLINVPVAQKWTLDDSQAVKQAITDVESDLGEGGRVLLRASGTEPLVRVMVEGIDKDRVETLAGQLAAVVSEAAQAH